MCNDRRYLKTESLRQYTRSHISWDAMRKKELVYRKWGTSTMWNSPCHESKGGEQPSKEVRGKTGRKWGKNSWSKKERKLDSSPMDTIQMNGKIHQKNLLSIPLTFERSNNFFPSGTLPCFPNATELKHSSGVKNWSNSRWNRRRQSFFDSWWMAASLTEDKKRPLSGKSSCRPTLEFGTSLLDPFLSSWARSMKTCSASISVTDRKTWFT